MEKIKKVLNFKILLAIIVGIFLLNAPAYATDLSSHVLRKQLDFNSQIKKTRYVCLYLAATYHYSILQDEVLPEKAFTNMREEMRKNNAGAMGIKIIRDMNDIWIYYENVSKEESIQILVHPNGEFEPKTRDDFNKARTSLKIAMSYIGHNLPKELTGIDRKEWLLEDFNNYIVPDSVDTRPFVSIPGLLLATGRPSYIDIVTFESEGKEIIFIDEDVYIRYRAAIHSGQKRVDAIDAVSVESLPDSFMPGGHLNRANRIILDIERKIRENGKELLNYVNEKRKELAVERGLNETEVRYINNEEELYEIAENVYVSFQSKPRVAAYAGRSENGKDNWIIFSLDYLSVLSDEEFAFVYGHELGHILVDMSIPYSEEEKKLHSAIKELSDRGAFNADGSYDISDYDKVLTKTEREKISSIFLKRENTADLTSANITGGSLQELKLALEKHRSTALGSEPVDKFIASLGITTHPDCFIRGFPIMLREMEERLKGWVTAVISNDTSSYAAPFNLPLMESVLEIPTIAFEPPDIGQMLQGLNSSLRCI